MKALLITAFATGIAGSSHCFAMCGGIGLRLGLQSQRSAFLWLYHLGRISSYALLAWFLSACLLLLGWRPSAWDGRLPRLLLALLMLLMALQALQPRWRFWQKAEAWGWRLWRRIQHGTHVFIPPRQGSDAFILGLFWGLLPCGLVYSAWGLALATAQPHQALLVMLAFGLGTLPALLLFQYLSQQWSASLMQYGKPVYVVLLLSCAVWTAYPLWHS